jgi:hypothetical protein
MISLITQCGLLFFLLISNLTANHLKDSWPSIYPDGSYQQSCTPCVLNDINCRQHFPIVRCNDNSALFFIENDLQQMGLTHAHHLINCNGVISRSPDCQHPPTNSDFPPGSYLKSCSPKSNHCQGDHCTLTAACMRNNRTIRYNTQFTYRTGMRCENHDGELICLS